jgi:hypothetical protein
MCRLTDQPATHTATSAKALKAWEVPSGSEAVVWAAAGQQREGVLVSVPDPAPNKRLQPTPYSLRCALASRRGSGPAFGVKCPEGRYCIGQQFFGHLQAKN